MGRWWSSAPFLTGSLLGGIARGLWQLVRALMAWVFSSPLLLITVPLIFLAVLLLIVLLFAFFIVAGPVLYIAWRLGRWRRRRRNGDGEVIEVEYWVDGERKG